MAGAPRWLKTDATWATMPGLDQDRVGAGEAVDDRAEVLEARPRPVVEAVVDRDDDRVRAAVEQPCEPDLFARRHRDRLRSRPARADARRRSGSAGSGAGIMYRIVAHHAIRRSLSDVKSRTLAPAHGTLGGRRPRCSDGRDGHVSEHRRDVAIHCRLGVGCARTRQTRPVEAVGPHRMSTVPAPPAGPFREQSAPRRKLAAGSLGKETWASESEARPRLRRDPHGRADRRAGLRRRPPPRVPARCPRRRAARRPRRPRRPRRRTGHPDPVAQLRHRGQRQGDRRPGQGLHAAKNPNVTIEVVSQPADNYFALLKAAAIAKTGPDLMTMWTGLFALQNQDLPRAAQPVHPGRHAQVVQRHRLVLEGPRRRTRAPSACRSTCSTTTASTTRSCSPRPGSRAFPTNWNEFYGGLRQAQGEPASCRWPTAPGGQALNAGFYPYYDLSYMMMYLPVGDWKKLYSGQIPWTDPAIVGAAHQVGDPQDQGLHERGRPPNSDSVALFEAGKAAMTLEGCVGLQGVPRQARRQGRRVRPAVHRHPGQGRRRVPGQRLRRHQLLAAQGRGRGVPRLDGHPRGPEDHRRRRAHPDRRGHVGRPSRWPTRCSTSRRTRATPATR